MGAFALSAGHVDAYYARAARVRRRIAEALAVAFERFDVLLAPTAPTVAWRQGERLHDPLSMYVADVTTCIANLAGVPALSLPAGAAEDGLPAGAQLIGPAWSEGRLLALARALDLTRPRRFPSTRAGRVLSSQGSTRAPVPVPRFEGARVPPNPHGAWLRPAAVLADRRRRPSADATRAEGVPR